MGEWKGKDEIEQEIGVCEISVEKKICKFGKGDMDKVAEEMWEDLEKGQRIFRGGIEVGGEIGWDSD